MWNISLPDFRIQYVILLNGMHTMYCVKWKVENDNIDFNL